MPPVWVDTQDILDLLVDDLSAQSRIAVDTESNSLHAYREQVCLIQFSTPKNDYIVDPLAINNLERLGPVFENPNIEKIFHAAEYDLICLKRDFGFEFENIFDTMQAARILGCQHVGLEKLLLEKFTVIMDKRHQKANWGHRPLTPAQLDYARMDTHHLSALRDIMEAELHAIGRIGFAEDDFLLVCDIEIPIERTNGSAWKRFASRKDVNLRDLTVLRELCLTRDEIAERLNRPTFKVISDALLLDIAKSKPEKDVDLAGLGMSQKQINMWGGQVLSALKRGAKASLVRKDPVKRPDEATLKRQEKLKAWRKKLAEDIKVDSDIILPKRFLHILADHPPQTIDELRSMMHKSPYRFNIYGSELLSLLGG